MKVGFRCEEDGWSQHGRKITAPDALAAIRRCLEDEGPIIVEHWFYRGSRAPDLMIFEEIDPFMEYLDSHAIAGDALHVWSFANTCRDDNELVHGKCPDDDGKVPRGGAY